MAALAAILDDDQIEMDDEGEEEELITAMGLLLSDQIGKLEGLKLQSMWAVSLQAME